MQTLRKAQILRTISPRPGQRGRSADCFPESGARGGLAGGISGSVTGGAREVPLGSTLGAAGVQPQFRTAVHAIIKNGHVVAALYRYGGGLAGIAVAPFERRSTGTVATAVLHYCFFSRAPTSMSEMA
jgi:hypothetical protein